MASLFTTDVRNASETSCHNAELSLTAQNIDSTMSDVGNSPSGLISLSNPPHPDGVDREEPSSHSFVESQGHENSTWKEDDDMIPEQISKAASSTNALRRSNRMLHQVATRTIANPADVQEIDNDSAMARVFENYSELPEVHATRT